jgi:glycosyltransferase involved in cell wall biosynthesis
MDTGNVVARTASLSWADATAATSVVVATHNRVDFLSGLLAALERQTIDVEVVITDDGSTDGTWQRLEQLAAATTLPVLALRVAHTGGPSLPRNTAVAHARCPWLAVTDDDCLPEPGWAAALVAALAGGAWVVQGATCPTDEGHGPWDRAVSVRQPSGLYETCNLGFPRERFVDLGGFPTLAVLAHLPRGFGEDVVFGVRAARGGGYAWAADAVVRHRWIHGTFGDHLQGVRRLSGFPWLAREYPEVAQRLHAGVFLSRRTAEYDAAAAGLALAVLTRRPLLAAAALPWLRSRLRSARGRPGQRRIATRLAQEAVADTVALASLVEGSAQHRRLVV